MHIRNSIHDLIEEMKEVRRLLHQNPQTAFEEHFAHKLIREKLDKWGVPYETGFGKTGIVATIEGAQNTSGKAIGLRADIDALDIIEENNKLWASKTPGKMHGCGHDGHTACMLGTAKYLSENNNFNGRVHIIFQPAEENGSGAKAMIKDGLFERFPCDAVYALHNWPYSPLGQIEINHGPAMAGVDKFEVTITGKGGHASKPHTLIDPIIITAHIITALQTLVSRETDPLKAAVLSVTNIHGGEGAFNVIPGEVHFNGTVRCYDMEISKKMENRMKNLISSIAEAMGASANVHYFHTTDPTINNAEHAQICADVAHSMFPAEKIVEDAAPSMGGEDFGVFLQHCPGAYIKFGQATPEEKNSPCNRGLHNAGYDFNDELIPIAVEYWARLIEHILPR